MGLAWYWWLAIGGGALLLLKRSSPAEQSISPPMDWSDIWGAATQPSGSDSVRLSEGFGSSGALPLTLPSSAYGGCCGAKQSAVIQPINAGQALYGDARPGDYAEQGGDAVTMPLSPAPAPAPAPPPTLQRVTTLSRPVVSAPAPSSSSSSSTVRLASAGVTGLPTIRTLPGGYL